MITIFLALVTSINVQEVVLSVKSNIEQLFSRLEGSTVFLRCWGLRAHA